MRTRPPTPSRSTPSSSWDGRRSTHGGRRGFKYIEAPHAELYDLEQDPPGDDESFAASSRRASRTCGKAGAALRQPARRPRTAVDRRGRERLGALGYVGGSRVPRPRVRRCATRRTASVFCRGSIAACPRRGRSPELAIRELTAVLHEDPGLLMARRTRAVAYAAAGRHELAVADLRLLDKDRPAHAGGRRRARATTSDSRDVWRKPFSVLERTARENPKFPQPLLVARRSPYSGRKYAEAAAACERVLQLVPDHIEALRRLGDLALLAGDFDAAETRYARILELDASDVRAMTKLGVVRMRSGRADEAMRLFRQAVEREPKNAEALLYLAGALASRGRPAEALPYFERALDAGPASTMALNGLGLTRLALGDRAGAAAAFRESLRLDPKQADIAQALAEVRRGGD